ncbi:retrovirus-related Pol polyprotein from transposon TNT 1-94 [Cucumis melo var. makuwa]|uniref:Retrovirus-related Pol polyprotein from transposon TNT 1-94 n=1 Tax=Cucumis melo var. makuwa TaxID=1194695 RepID=A0A5D3BWY1_CUCMM|nr:retrovirus-related Pol polyprotein from transposon TNT 1-94 [Cucumis melo var. makuwa]TYK03478.1 retrovirus-related Pol polyprotein from transposon TNT 1-94 [Cucumis melo var. makuwa]
MSQAKSVSSPLLSHFKLSSKQSPSTDKEKEDMKKQHWKAVKCIMRYLRDTSSLKFTFGDGKPVFVGVLASRLQKCVVLSTTEAGYITTAEACKEMLWMKCFIQELGFKQQ